MIAQSISGFTPGAASIPAPAPASGSAFSDMLSGIQASLSTTSASQVNARDEDEALKELFHLLAMLSLGIVDGTALTAHETTPGEAPGPQREAVERLKEVLRKLTQCGQDGYTTTLDPVTGKPRAHSSGASLRELVDSLPADLRNLLRRAFPKLDDMLRAGPDRDLEA